MPASVSVKMYNQLNLGDCFLLTFSEEEQRSFVLIDFGSYESGNDDREMEIAEDIQKTVGNQPLTIVLTHQHRDHLSGFISCVSVFKKMKIREVWLSYLDDPGGPEAITMRKRTEQFWNKNKRIKKLVKDKFNSVASVRKMLHSKEGFDLFAEDQTGGEAITNLLTWSKNKKKFLIPGQHFDLPLIGNDQVKVYVLGPPTDPELMRKLNPGKGEGVHGLGAMMELMNMDTSTNLMADALSSLSSSVTTTKSMENFPFNKKYSTHDGDQRDLDYIKGLYNKKDNAWRRIDHEWLSEVGRVSLHMHSLTNNSSLVLAFELVESGKVLLFVGDAQIGNWKSWKDVSFENTNVDIYDLLTRTVLYKAGHHGSHNATLLESLDLMNTEELVIMVPVNEKISKKRRFSMLRPGMMLGYNRKTCGRVLRSDTIFHKADSTNCYKFPFAKTDKDFKPKIRIGKDNTGGHLFIEYVVT
ncbi:hypothetical protein [Longitalea arenae]|uniref:hypothetical protein n=1 Tax=Longitalea arenae TaxID=2812558 RepID=UPI0019689AF6|nr:hypothetical protein [Longitalea arenae]